ncbi:MAG: Lrp/AsnC family transcriptional regulator [Erythrobacter sp.]|nr:Lrp/AsnC family transcriptional regulator [Erythrobacter sp.]
MSAIVRSTAGMSANSHVKQAYHVSGTTDYVLVVRGPSLAWYEKWATQTLMSDHNIKRHDTSLVYSCKKLEPAIEI